MSSILELVLADQKLGPTALQRITTVKIQPKLQWDEPASGIRCDACVGLLKAPNLTIFDAYNEAGGWAALPHTLKDVRLSGALEPGTLDTICNIPVLERLTVHPNSDELSAEFDIEGDVFNTALAKHASTLKYLQFVTRGNDTLMPGYGPRKYLHCLGEFQRLEELEIDIFALLVDSTNLDPETCPLLDILPQGLTCLTLWERWPVTDPVFGLEGDDLNAYLDHFHIALMSIAQSCASGRMPTLRKFHLYLHNDLVSKDESWPMDEPSLKRLKKSFADAGVTMWDSC